MAKEEKQQATTQLKGQDILRSIEAPDRKKEIAEFAIGDTIEVGVEIINPVQTSARGMDPARLKREFGKDIVFWGGGCDTQQVLPLGTPDEIDAHVKERIETFAPGGGFVFTQVHNIMPNVPPRNIVAMFDAVKKYR